MRCHLYAARRVAQVDDRVERRHVEQVERPALVPRPGACRAVGDPLHLLELLGIETAQEQQVGAQAQARPPGRRFLAVLLDRELREVGDDLVGEQRPVLKPAGVRRALDVEHDPAAVIVAEPSPRQRTVLAPPAPRRRSPPPTVVVEQAVPVAVVRPRWGCDPPRVA